MELNDKKTEVTADSLKQTAETLGRLRQWISRGGAKYASDLGGVSLAEAKAALRFAAGTLRAEARLFSATERMASAKEEANG